MQTINRPSHIASWSRELGAQTAVFRQVKQGLGFSVEKQNQTMRRHRKRFARLTACHSKRWPYGSPLTLLV
jgi:IS1 family transposase